MPDPNHTVWSTEGASARGPGLRTKGLKPLGKEWGDKSVARGRQGLPGPLPDARPLRRREQPLQTDQMNFDTLTVPLELFGSVGYQS
jgi:hypothetical protein